MIGMERNITILSLRCTSHSVIRMGMRQYIGLEGCLLVARIQGILFVGWWILRAKISMILRRLFLRTQSMKSVKKWVCPNANSRFSMPHTTLRMHQKIIVSIWRCNRCTRILWNMETSEFHSIFAMLQQLLWKKRGIEKAMNTLTILPTKKVNKNTSLMNYREESTEYKESMTRNLFSWQKNSLY